MTSLLPSLIAIVLYAGVSGYQSVCLKHRQPIQRSLLLSLTAVGLVAQLISLSLQLWSPPMLLLNFFSAGSLVTATVVLLTLLGCSRMPIENLFVLLLPLAALSVLLAQWAPISRTPNLVESPGLIAHILLSIVAYGMLTMAMLQALLLSMQNQVLKQKKSPTGLIRNLPPLQTMESLLFGFLWAGWIILTASLISGWVFLDDLLARHVAHKTLLSVLAWCVFGLLLWGRHRLGWRGHTAIRWTLAGFCLLMLAYFGSKLVREFILFS